MAQPVSPEEGVVQPQRQLMTVAVFQNQRKQVLGSRGFGAENLLAMERSEWTDELGQPSQRSDPSLLPEHWAWEEDWHIVQTSETDEQGWQYCFNWPAQEDTAGMLRLFSGAVWSGQEGGNTWVRRRRWQRQRRYSPTSDSGTANASHASETPCRLNEIQSIDASGHVHSSAVHQAVANEGVAIISGGHFLWRRAESPPLPNVEPEPEPDPEPELEPEPANKPEPEAEAEAEAEPANEPEPEPEAEAESSRPTNEPKISSGPAGGTIVLTYANPGPLGLKLHWPAVSEPVTAAAGSALDELPAGMVLYMIQSTNVEGMSAKEATQCLRSAKRPLQLAFREPTAPARTLSLIGGVGRAAAEAGAADQALTHHAGHKVVVEVDSATGLPPSSSWYPLEAVREWWPLTPLPHRLLTPELRWQPRGEWRILQGCARETPGVT